MAGPVGSLGTCRELPLLDWELREFSESMCLLGCPLMSDIAGAPSHGVTPPVMNHVLMLSSQVLAAKFLRILFQRRLTPRYA